MQDPAKKKNKLANGILKEPLEKRASLKKWEV